MITLPKDGPDLAHIAAPLRPLALPLSDLTLDSANARTHDEKNLAAIKGSLSRFGQCLPLVGQRQGMIVRAGNGRVRGNWVGRTWRALPTDAFDAAGFGTDDLSDLLDKRAPEAEVIAVDEAGNESAPATLTLFLG